MFHSSANAAAKGRKWIPHAGPYLCFLVGVVVLKKQKLFTGLDQHGLSLHCNLSGLFHCAGPVCSSFVILFFVFPFPVCFAILAYIRKKITKQLSNFWFSFSYFFSVSRDTKLGISFSAWHPWGAFLRCCTKTWGSSGWGEFFFSSESVYSGALDIHFGHGCPRVFVAGMDVGCLGVDWFWGEELLLFGLATFMF